VAAAIAFPEEILCSLRSRPAFLANSAKDCRSHTTHTPQHTVTHITHLHSDAQHCFLTPHSRGYQGTTTPETACSLYIVHTVYLCILEQRACFLSLHTVHTLVLRALMALADSLSLTKALPSSHHTRFQCRFTCCSLCSRL